MQSDASENAALFEIARVLVRLGHIAGRIVKRGSRLRVATVHCVTDCIIRCVIPQATEWQNSGNQINAAFVATRWDFVRVHKASAIDIAILAGLVASRGGPAAECGRGAPGMCSGLSPMIAAKRGLNSSTVSTSHCCSDILGPVVVFVVG